MSATSGKHITAPIVLEVDGIVKSFGAVRALADASLVVHEGEIVPDPKDKGQPA